MRGRWVTIGRRESRSDRGGGGRAGGKRPFWPFLASPRSFERLSPLDVRVKTLLRDRPGWPSASSVSLLVEFMSLGACAAHRRALNPCSPSFRCDAAVGAPPRWGGLLARAPRGRTGLGRILGPSEGVRDRAPRSRICVFASSGTRRGHGAHPTAPSKSASDVASLHAGASFHAGGSSPVQNLVRLPVFLSQTVLLPAGTGLLRAYEPKYVR